MSLEFSIFDFFRSVGEKIKNVSEKASTTIKVNTLKTENNINNSSLLKLINKEEKYLSQCKVEYNKIIEQLSNYDFLNTAISDFKKKYEQYKNEIVAQNKKLGDAIENSKTISTLYKNEDFIAKMNDVLKNSRKLIKESNNIYQKCHKGLIDLINEYALMNEYAKKANDYINYLSKYSEFDNLRNDFVSALKRVNKPSDFKNIVDEKIAVIGNYINKLIEDNAKKESEKIFKQAKEESEKFLNEIKEFVYEYDALNFDEIREEKIQSLLDIFASVKDVNQVYLGQYKDLLNSIEAILEDDTITTREIDGKIDVLQEFKYNVDNFNEKFNRYNLIIEPLKYLPDKYQVEAFQINKFTNENNFENLRNEVEKKLNDYFKSDYFNDVKKGYEEKGYIEIENEYETISSGEYEQRRYLFVNKDDPYMGKLVIVANNGQEQLSLDVPLLLQVDGNKYCLENNRENLDKLNNLCSHKGNKWKEMKYYSLDEESSKQYFESCMKKQEVSVNIENYFEGFSPKYVNEKFASANVIKNGNINIQNKNIDLKKFMSQGKK